MLVIADLNEDAAEATCKEAVNYATQASFRSFAAVVDVTDEARVNEVVQSTVEDCGRIDYCVHCAGVSSSLSISGSMQHAFRQHEADATCICLPGGLQPQLFSSIQV